MDFIKYLIYCTLLVISIGTGNGGDGRLIDMIVGITCWFVLVDIVLAISIVLGLIIKKKRKYKVNKNDFIEVSTTAEQSPLVEKAKPLKKNNERDFMK